ncbi:hypothetical protein P5673_015395, partial [Acropora cervicornis]
RFPITYVLWPQEAMCVLSPGIFIQARYPTQVLQFYRSFLPLHLRPPYSIAAVVKLSYPVYHSALSHDALHNGTA